MIRELVGGAVAIVATTIGLLVIAVMNNVAIEMADAWWQWIIGLAIAGGLSLVAIAIIFGAMTLTLGQVAAGWAGMLAGRVPQGFGPGDGNFGRGLGSLGLFAAAVALGIPLRRAGVEGGNLNWAVEGLFLIGAGVAIGLMAAIPRFYFAARAAGNPIEGGRARRKRQALPVGAGGETATVLATLALVSVALSMCTADLVANARARDGVATLPYGDWIDGCVDATFDECTRRAELTLIPRRATRLRLEYIARCTVRVLHHDGRPVDFVSIGEMKRRGVSPGGTAYERTRRMIDARPGDRYRIEIEPVGGDLCGYSVRYLDEPTGPAGEGE